MATIMATIVATCLATLGTLSSESGILCLTAVSVGAIHTLLGPDHYLPFVAMSRAGGWSARKTLGVTVACGLGHVAGSVAIGMIGLLLGIAVMRLEGLESLRGDLAGWLLIGFGLAYLSWGIVHAVRGVSHAHVHAHADGTVHSHVHKHHGEHGHVHAAAGGRPSGRRGCCFSSSSSVPASRSFRC